MGQLDHLAGAIAECGKLSIVAARPEPLTRR
jgi:hypothetical protein